jgi:flagellar assembly protein FliH
MPHHSVRSGWVQHGKVRVKAVSTHLPHLWEAPADVDHPLDAPEPHIPLPIHAPGVIDSAIAEAEMQARISAIEAEAQAQIAAAQAEAERWRQHALQSESDGYSRGFNAGYNDGVKQGQTEGAAAVKAESRAQIDQLVALTKAARVETRTALLATREQLTQLSIEIARAIIGEALHVDEDLLSRRVSHLLETIGESATAIVRVAPLDLPKLQPSWAAASRARRMGERGPRVVADESLAPGDCIVEGTVRYLDARLEPLFTRVAEAFAAIPPEPSAAEEAA